VRWFVCKYCGEIHAFPGGLSAAAKKIVMACQKCGARIDMVPRKFFGYLWPKITMKPPA